jgi:hypothetical protein
MIHMINVAVQRVLVIIKENCIDVEVVATKHGIGGLRPSARRSLCSCSCPFHRDGSPPVLITSPSASRKSASRVALSKMLLQDVLQVRTCTQCRFAAESCGIARHRELQCLAAGVASAPGASWETGLARNWSKLSLPEPRGAVESICMHAWWSEGSS